jgi:hypothetical protein
VLFVHHRGLPQRCRTPTRKSSAYPQQGSGPGGLRGFSQRGAGCAGKRPPRKLAGAIFLATACQVARSPVRIRPIRSAPESFYFQASNGSVALPLLDMTTTATLLAGLSPARMAVSLAAPDPYERHSRPVKRLDRREDGRGIYHLSDPRSEMPSAVAASRSSASKVARDKLRRCASSR